MKVLVIGSGGREHALCWAIANSPLVTELFAAPGNGGIASVATLIDLKPEDIAGLVTWACDNTIDFCVPGPEAPLVAGPSLSFASFIHRFRVAPMTDLTTLRNIVPAMDALGVCGGGA